MNRSIVSSVGHNGAGKTTTINMLIGLLSPDQGTYNYNTDNQTQELR